MKSTTKRNGVICGLDFEYYSGLFVLIYDVIAVAFFAAVVIGTLYLYKPADGPRSVGFYAALGVFFFVWYNVVKAGYYTIEGIIIHEDNWDKYDKQDFFVMALTGMRTRRGVFGIVEYLMNLSLFSPLLSIFYATGMYIFIEVVLVETSGVWFTAITTYPEAISKQGCTATTMSDIAARHFFEITNMPSVISALMGMNGVYFNVMSYRSKARMLFRYVMPSLLQACNGTRNDVSYDTDNIAKASSVVFSFIVAITPLAVLRDTYTVFHNFWVWIITCVASFTCLFSIYVMSDVGMVFFSSLINEFTYKRVNSENTDAYFMYNGWDHRVVCLALMTACSFCLAGCSSSRSSVPEADESTSPVGRLAARAVKFPKMVFRLILSEAFLFSAAALLLCFVVSSKGLPLKNIQFKKIFTPLPDYMAKNSLEVALSTESTIPLMFARVVSVLADTIGVGIDSIVSRFDKCINLGLDRVCVSTILGGLFGVIKDAFIAAINFMASSLESITKQVDAALAGVFNALNIDLDLFTTLTGLFDSVTSAPEKIMGWIPSWTQHAPLIAMIFGIAASVLGLVMPSIASFIQMGILTSIFQSVVGLVVFVLFVRSKIEEFGYKVILTWDYQLLALDVAALSCVFVSILMLCTQDLYANSQVDPVMDQMLQHHKTDTKNDTRRTYRAAMSTTGEMMPFVRKYYIN